MGEQKVTTLKDSGQMSRFVQYLLNDLRSFEYMLEKNWFEDDITRIGAEQEMCIIDRRTYKPAPIAMEALEKMKDYEWVETELARFNLEINLPPYEFKGDCLRKLENGTKERLGKIREKLWEFDADILLTGILPTLRKFHLEMNYLTPKRRYFALMEAINESLMGNAYELRLSGIDELLVKHGSPLLEACNTSFQVHLQVSPADFVKMYNISQAVAAPIIAISANSPIVFGRRLWHESRIALFQQALDTRTTHDHMRERSPRVNFGNDWLHSSIMEIYKEDIARFRVLLAGDIEEDSIALLSEGKVPKLRALQVHNSTVYRWNRPCYGVSPNGKPHIRIENRVLPAGPTVLDEIANAAFWLGLMVGYGNEPLDVRDRLSFADAKDNFIKASRYGVDATFSWFDDRKIEACDLILNELIPMARKGLETKQINPDDINRYLGVIEKRAANHMNGARWSLRAYTKLKTTCSIDESLVVLTSSIFKNQIKEIPGHEWEMPKISDLEDYRPSKLKVEEFMTTDLFTVQKDDILELVVEMMDWRKIRYTPVEDAKGKLVGLVTSRILLRHFSRPKKIKGDKLLLVKDIMIEDPVTISPEATLFEAMKTMAKKKIGCLPVVFGNDLVGIITEENFLRISASLLERLEEEE